jgi:hypothetical protein
MDLRTGGWSRWALAALLGGLMLLILAPGAFAAGGTAGISGTVTSACACEDFQPLKHIEVTVYEAEGKELLVGKAITEANGEYTVTELQAGSYTVVFYPVYGSGLNFVPQYYENTPFFKNAKPVKVKEGETKKGINAELQEGGEMSGTVTDAGTHKPLAGAGVVAYPLGAIEEVFRGHAVTNANGEYTIFGLEPGEYVIEFESPGGVEGEYIGQFYNGQQSPLNASHVTAAQGSTPTPNIDAALVRKEPVNTVSPVVVGTPAVGQTLSCTDDSWTGAPKLSFAYQWLRNGAAIAGASGMTYGVQAADQGTGLSCTVTATNEYGHATATSNTVGVPAPTVTVITQSRPPSPPAPVVTLASSASKLAVSGNATHVRIACAAAPCAGSVEVVEQVVVTHRKGTRTILKAETIVLAKGSYSLAAGSTGKITLRLTAAGRKRLAHARHHRVSGKLLLSVRGGRQLEKTVQLSLAARGGGNPVSVVVG